jgi:hypothetical protein
VQDESTIHQLDVSIDDYDIIEEDSVIHQKVIPFEDKKDEEGEEVKPIVKKRVVISTEPLKQEEDIIPNELTNEEVLDDFNDIEPSEILDEQYPSTSFISQEVFDIQDDDDVNLSQDEDLIQSGQDMLIHSKPSVGADASFVSIDNNQFEKDWEASIIENTDGENTDGENTDGENTDDENTDDENTDDENTDGENTDDKNTDDENSFKEENTLKDKVDDVSYLFTNYFAFMCYSI